MKERLQVYISPYADALLRKMAAADRRSISATVEMLIVNAAITADNKNEKSRHVD